MLSQRIAVKLSPFIDDMRERHAPFYKKVKSQYDASLANDRSLIQQSKYFAAVYLWFMAINVLYTSLRFTVPYVIGDVWGFDSWTVYWCKVVIAFGFVQITANWTCIRCYTSYYERTEDRPDLQKTLWDSHPEDQMKKTDNDNSSANSASVNGPHDSADMEVRSKGLPAGYQGRWQYCAVCQRDMPPRAHHCKVCRKCTLKRDHHCFIVGACIGFWNQRYFVVLTFYLMVYAGICLFLAYFYIRDIMWPASVALDYFLPYTTFRWLFMGSQPLEHVFIMTQIYTFVWVGPMSASFFFLQIMCIVTGKTMHEFTRNIPMKITSTISENFQSVFGAFWAFNFLMPAVILFRQTGDGIHWSKVYMVIRRNKGPESITIKERSQ